MSDEMREHGTTRPRSARTGHPRRSRPARRACMALVVVATLVAALPVQLARTAPAALPPPPFSSQVAGDIGSQSPLGTDFSSGCNVHATTAAVKVAGVQLAVGAALENLDGCGDGHLFLSVPGTGHFQGTLTLDDAATLPATSVPLARIFVLGHGGYILRTVDVPAGTGRSAPIDIDVSGGEMLSVGMPSTAHSYLYAMHLTGSAHLRRATPLAGSGAPAGAMPVDLSRITYSCNAHIATPPVSIGRLTIPAPSSVWASSCGTVTVTVPPGATGTFAMRYGVYDDSGFTATPIVVEARVLDASGLLLRKSVGLAYQGGGLQPLWVNVTGGVQVSLAVEGGSSYVGFVGLSFLPGHYAPHPNPDHNVFGSPTGGPVAIVPQSFAFDCNAHVGADDVLVNRASVLRNSYIWATGCGVASLIMTNATGTFHALVGVQDTQPAGSTAKVDVTVLDQNARPLYTGSVTARQGSSAVPLNVPITGGSILKLELANTNSYTIVYDMHMTGRATLYDRVFPPSEPPVVIRGGVPVNPRAFALTCNADVTKQDVLLIHAAALEQWTLEGTGCGVATLDLTRATYPRHTFGGRFGLAASDQRYKVGHLTVAVLDGKGKVVRSRALTAREGYGPQPFTIGLSGGVRLQLTWADQSVKLFAMTLA